MSVIANFKELIGIVSIIPKLVKINAAERQKIRDSVGTVADELIRGLDLVQSRIQGAKVFASSKNKGAKENLERYMSESTEKLSDSFSEFQICRGLRETRDQFVRPFSAVRASVNVKNIEKIDNLIYQLEHDEKMIVDEVGPMLDKLHTAAGGSRREFLLLADKQIGKIKKRKRKLRRLARQIHEVL